MSIQLRVFATAAVILFCSYSVLAKKKPDNYCADSHTTPTNATVFKSQLLFADKLFRVICATKPYENVVISPFSMSTALMMVMVGSAGQTLDELSQALLQIPGKNYADVTKAVNLYSQVVKSLISIKDYEIDENGKNVTSLLVRLANYGFPDNQFNLLPSFTKTIREKFDGAFIPVDWHTLPNTQAIDTVNKNVNKSTMGLIPELLEPPIPKTNVLTLVNTLYFKGAWAVPFEKQATRNGTFHAHDGDIKVLFMSKTRNVRYFSSPKPGYEAIILDYKKSEFNMICVLPNEGKNLSQFVNKFGAEELQSIVLNSSYQLVDMKIPLVKNLRLKQQWADYLADKFNMYDLFHNANLSKLAKPNKCKPLKVDSVTQECDISMDESGTEAAAATAVGIGVATGVAEPPPTPRPFYLNRPCLLYLTKTSTKDKNADIVVLFITQLAKPVQT